MNTVVIYGFEGQFNGHSEYAYSFPEIGANHRCMLFLSQVSASPEYENAIIECSKYGFIEVQFSGAGAIDISVLNTDQYRGFSGFYEEALSEGSSLVYYPNA